MPVILIGLVLGILMVEVRPAGPPIYSTPAEWTEKGLFPRSSVNVAVNSHQLGTHMVSLSLQSQLNAYNPRANRPDFDRVSHRAIHNRSLAHSPCSLALLTLTAPSF